VIQTGHKKQFYKAAKLDVNFQQV